jgi:hypothetical protein
MKNLLLIWLLGSWGLLSAQNHFQWEINTGGGAGWWYHLRQADSLGGERMDRTHFSPTFVLATRLGWQSQRWGIALSYQHRILFDDELVAFDDRSPRRVRIPIAPQGASLHRNLLGLQLSYFLLNKEKYRLSAALEVGSFDLNSLHPDQENFAFRWYREFQIRQSWQLSSRLRFLVHMQFSRSALFLQRPRFEGEQHSFISLELNGGFQYQFGKKYKKRPNRLAHRK